MIATSWLAPESWRASQDEAILDACREGPDWSDYLRLVDRHRTPALGWAALKRVSSIKIPESVALEMRKRSDACRMMAAINFQMLARLLNRFNRDTIPVMPLKGPLLSLALYGDIGLRQSKDLDIVVAPEDILRAQQCLESLGWHSSAAYSSLSPRQLKFNLQHEHHIAYCHPQYHCELELHWRASWDIPEFAADRLARNIACEWKGCSYRIMSPVDLTLYLCNHGSDHAWCRAKWLGDLARMFAGESVDLRAAFDQAHKSGQERSLLICLRLLRDAYGLPMHDRLNCLAERVPSALINKAIRELTKSSERNARGALARLFEEVRSYGYNRRLWSYKTRWETFIEISFCLLDFNVLRLPDRFFWLYVPLRPFLWAWRCLRDFIRTRKISVRASSSS
jgi:hypothetical protein